MSKTGVETEHKQFSRRKFEWRTVRESIEGSDTVKRGNVVYLPMPAGFEVNDTSPSVSYPHTISAIDNLIDQYDQTTAPWWHPNPAYRAYLQRARFPEITLNTLRGLIGVATKANPEMELPTSMAYLETAATKKGSNLKDLFVQMLIATLSGGRCALAVDIDPVTNEARLVLYKTQNITNWRVNEMSGATQMVVLKECVEIPGDDGFCCDDEDVFYVYRQYPALVTSTNEDTGAEETNVHRDLAGKVVLEKYMNDILISQTIPQLQGTEFETVPVIPIGSLENEFTPGPVPLASITEIALSIYRKDADLSQAQYMTCNPIFTITGAEAEQLPVAFGSTVALVLENPQAKAFFPATDTGALDHVGRSIVQLFDEAAKYGATLLGPSQTSAEATDTVKIRQSQQGATLIGVVNNIIRGINDALKVVAQIEGADPELVSFNMSTDFAETVLDAPMALALMQLWQNGLYSKESFIKILIENGLIDSAQEVEDELARIFNEAPSSSPDMGEFADDNDDPTLQDD
jgi:hypothetical protein